VEDAAAPEEPVGQQDRVAGVRGRAAPRRRGSLLAVPRDDLGRHFPADRRCRPRDDARCRAGIKYAMEDAVEEANVLATPLQARRVRTGHLAEAQRRREWPARLIQAGGGLAQRVVGPR
jgi:hypothetical protein